MTFIRPQRTRKAGEGSADGRKPSTGLRGFIRFRSCVQRPSFFRGLNPDLRVKAIGVNGYNMVQELMWMKELAPRMKGKLAIWFVYLGNDLTDSLVTNIEGYRIPFVREKGETGSWEIVTSHLSAEAWPSGPGYHNATFYERVGKIFVPGPFSARVFSACEHLISEADQVTRQAGSRLVVVSIPSKNMLVEKDMQRLKEHFSDDTKFDVDYPDRRLGGICHELGVHFIAGKDHLQATHYRRCESHWNKKGSRRVSRLLWEIHSQCRAVESGVLTTDASNMRSSSHPELESPRV